MQAALQQLREAVHAVKQAGIKIKYGEATLDAHTTVYIMVYGILLTPDDDFELLV